MKWDICFLVLKPTQYMPLSVVGLVGPLKVSKIPISDYGFHLKGIQTPHTWVTYLHFALFVCKFRTTTQTHEVHGQQIQLRQTQLSFVLDISLQSQILISGTVVCNPVLCVVQNLMIYYLYLQTIVCKCHTFNQHISRRQLIKRVGCWCMEIKRFHFQITVYPKSAPSWSTFWLGCKGPGPLGPAW